VKDADKVAAESITRTFLSLGFEVVATRGTAQWLTARGLKVATINKVAEGRPHVVDAIINGDFAMIINTTAGARSVEDSRPIRRATVHAALPYFTTVAGAQAAALAMQARNDDASLGVAPLQEYHSRL
jgi:carbamoyl-phosphate synthase large subunit